MDRRKRDSALLAWYQSLTPEDRAEVREFVVANGAELGGGWRDAYEKLKEWFRRRKKKPPAPPPVVPKLPGPPEWLIVVAALYLLWLWDR